jgi:hypothetical protein
MRQAYKNMLQAQNEYRAQRAAGRKSDPQEEERMQRYSQECDRIDRVLKAVEALNASVG